MGTSSADKPTPAVAPSPSTTAADLRVWHQTSTLSFVYVRPVIDSPAAWRCQGRAVLYVVDETAKPDSSLALHLRGSCRVLDFKAETVAKQSEEDRGVSLVPVNVSYQHFDPLAHVLLKPTLSCSENHGYDADSQCSRGAVGMTTGLRAASVASSMGELRLVISDDSKSPSVSKDELFECWKEDLSQNLSHDGRVVERLKDQLHQRSAGRREDRINLISHRLAEASSSKADDEANSSATSSAKGALKLTIHYEIPLVGDQTSAHMGGIHFHANSTPHVYTTAGVMGDHEGPRSWTPCLDSASYKHRASREIVIKVSALMREGLSPVGCGEDFGTGETLLHDLTCVNGADEELGQDHVRLVKGFFQQSVDHVLENGANDAAPHVIPPDKPVATIDSILATSVWCSDIWTPIPARSMGFAVAPLKTLYDPEYYSTIEEDENSNGEDVDGQTLFVERSRVNGEGIRQMYFSPIYERKHIHAKANMSLLPNTDILLAPLGRRQTEQSQGIDQTVAANTCGIANRALSLMRDVLALPAYRTASYTQIWIPEAVHGGSTSGALHCCPEVLTNAFLGGAIMDSRLLPPVGGFRLPYYSGGRTLQFLQARCAVRGWIVGALPLGGHDDVGFGYIHTLFESFIMSLYERAHGAHGEGGANGGVFFTKRYAVTSGLNSKNLDFLPVPNIEEEELDVVVGGVVGAVPIEDRNNDQLWRSASNGSESHTSAMDEFAYRQVLFKDIVDALERGTDKDKSVPLPGFGWLGSHLSLSFLSSNSASSSALGGGSLELVHPVGGIVYRTLKCEVLRRIVEGRAGVAAFLRVMRAAFIAAHMEDKGDTELKLPNENEKVRKESEEEEKAEEDVEQKVLPRFALCVDELLKKHGLTHTLFIVALRKLAGHREPHLRGTLVDVERENRDPRTHRQIVEPEGFPNSYVRGASELYLRVGTHVEPTGASDGSSSQTTASSVKRFQLHVFAEPIIPEGGLAFGGPVTLRVVENEGQNHFLVRTLKSDGSRCDWGPISLHTTKPVTTARQQTAASGAIDQSSTMKESKVTGSAANESSGSAQKRLLGEGDGIFNDANLHGGGYQAIELIRLTNRTPLLWIRVDPQGLYGGRISVSQPDACLAELLFHDGDAGAQIHAIRALAERPLRIQGSVKVSTVYDVNVSELPVRVLGDCLRGQPALHSSLPHTPAVRAQAALAIAQWQNNKAPGSAGALGAESWIGLNLLMQYFNERYFSNGIAVPVKYSRLALKKSEAEVRKSGHVTEGGSGNNPSGTDDAFQYVDTIDDEGEKAEAVKDAEELEIEEDEEYRIRSAVLTAIASVRAKDGSTPSVVLRFLKTILLSGNASTMGNVVSPDEEVMIHQKRRAIQANESEESETEANFASNDSTNAAGLSYVPSMLVADSLLALCHLNVRPALVVDPATGKPVQSKAKHPVLPLMEVAHQWLEWELYRETIRREAEEEAYTGIGGGCHAPIAACAITALYSLAILQQSTTDRSDQSANAAAESVNAGSKRKIASGNKLDDAATSQFYIDMFDEEPRRSDVTRCACAQAVACICCAADRFETESPEPLGLLTALEFLLQRILDPCSSPSLRQTLALLMIDSCTGKVCSMQRVGTIGGRGDLCTSGSRFMTGPLGASHGGDNGSALLMTVSEGSYPAANAVNNGARRGLRLLTRAGHPHDVTGRDHIVVRVAKFATSLWRTINGERVVHEANSPAEAPSPKPAGLDGVCSHDGSLRCTLLSLWQWIWPKGCFAVLRVQSWRSLEGSQRYKELGADLVMKISDEEKKAAHAEEASFASFKQIVATEIDRQVWRGEMAMASWRNFRADRKCASMIKDGAGANDQVGQPLPPVQRDNAFKQGGWIASAAQQRRAMTLDGGTAVKKIRLTMKSSSGVAE